MKAKRANGVPLSLLRFSLASEERADHARKAALALNDGRWARRVRLALLRVGRLLQLRAARVPMLLPRAAGGSAMAALRQLLAFRYHAGASFAQLVIARRCHRRALRATLPIARRLAVAAGLAVAAMLAIAAALAIAARLEFGARTALPIVS